MQTLCEIASGDDEGCLRADGAELAATKRLRENPGVDEAERVPLGGGFGFEIPAHTITKSVQPFPHINKEECRW